MRNYLQNVNIVGATLCYQEGEQCRWSLDWLYQHCDRVCIVLDNFDDKTVGVVKEYQNKYPERTHLAYSDIAVQDRTNKVQGQIKRRYKLNQHHIREIVVKELRKMHDENPIDLLVWPDSDEVFINEFPKYLEQFWHNKRYDYMMLGFVEVYDRMDVLVQQKMSPHGRVFRYHSEMTVYPWKGRTRYHPYFYDKKPWKVRHVVVHVCHLTEEYRQRRKFFDNANFEDICDRRIWLLPKDVREMKADEIADYQPGPHGAPSKYPSMSLQEYLNMKKSILDNQ